MNRKALIVAGVALVSVALAAQQGVTLKRDLKENATEIYKLESEFKQTIMLPTGDQDVSVNSSMKMTLKTGKVDDKGQAAVESTLSDIQTKAEGAMADMMDQMKGNLPKEITAKGTLNQRNHLALESPKGAGALQMILGSSSPTSALLFVEFPDKALAVGDSWTYEIPKTPMFGSTAQKLTAKLSAEKTYEGVSCWVVNVSGTLKMDVDMSEMMKDMPDNPASGMKMLMKGTMDVNGEALVDKASGKTLLYTTNVKTKNTTELPDMGMSIDSNGSAKTTLTLQK